ncbi:hypothetical protein [Streptomyces sp. NPDC058625]|uniref:hypothetical protein n=1 Tax=Streptomyces sp. NPDC058625 TaxID=3346564 RepID=UPI003665EE25
MPLGPVKALSLFEPAADQVAVRVPHVLVAALIEPGRGRRPGDEAGRAVAAEVSGQNT